MSPQRFGHTEQVADFHLFTGLHALDGVASQFRCFPEALLCPVELYAADSDAVPDSPAGVDDPRWMFGGHVVHAGTKMILCQPQFRGII